MIDREARAELAEAVRQLATDVISNDAFEDSLGTVVYKSQDPAVYAVRDAAGRLYDDGREYRLEGSKALDASTLATVSRWIRFLESDLEYEWRDAPGWGTWFLVLPNLVSFGLIGRLVRRWVAQRGDADVWPFIRRSDAERWSVDHQR